ncbi:diaminopimelate decarboxylase [Buchananella hordeovulneris]|uniref:diaminopimelate decarboxylase n=1 Tax=Buchananella hordeovulneris TaxID=52770 RepID=UPI000F5FD229|nr:diaminopimelate decarboxylase [Buchananella hordeovulneris]RRD45144.1 diaminopimelate decarboxylase [Buchananella hordeovulneris]RRD53044.1 diaminopimelate decarboxylase [Buchananella hordeovulneris]
MTGGAPLACPEPDQRPDLWPANVRRAADGALTMAGQRLPDLAAQFSTPAYLLDAADLAGRAEVYATAFAEEFWPNYGMNGADVYYAGKAFLCRYVVRAVVDHGLGVDTATGGELEIALAAGADPGRLTLHGNNKSRAEIERALQVGVGRLVLDSLPEIDFVAEIAARLGVVAPVMVRVTTGVHAGGHSYISTAHEDQKFGLSVAAGSALEALTRVAAHPQLRLVGIHSHIGSQIFDLTGYQVAGRAILELRAALQARGIAVPEVDFGGGVAVAYTDADPVAPSAATFARTLAELVRTECERLGTDVPHVSVEMGRAIIAPTTLTLYTVGTVKPVQLDDGGSRLYVSVDGGMSDNIRPALYGAAYTATLANRRSAAQLVTARVVGRHCESGDIVVHDVALPADITAGDLLAVPVTGAYGRSMASNYNAVPRPPVVAVTQDGAQAIVRRETVADLLSLDIG